MNIRNYYYSYLKSFVDFLVPENANVLFVDDSIGQRGNITKLSDSVFDYVVVSDVLGRIDDIESFLVSAERTLTDDGRLIITQYSSLWAPIIRFASKLGMRRKIMERNWLTMQDLKNSLYISGLETVKSGTKVLLPIYIPLVSFFFNRILANVWPFNKLGIFHYVVAKRAVRSVRRSNPSLSIVVPARNEAGTIERIVKELPDLGLFTEIIFIEGNSTDNTYAEIERVAKAYAGRRKIKVAKQKGKGKGDAVRLGFEMSEGDILAIYDADMTVPPDEVVKFYNAIAEDKADFINGSRLVYSMQKQSMRVLNFIGNKFFSLAFTWILGQSLKDTLCGTKVLWKSDYEKIKAGRAFFGDFDPFGDFDLLFGAAKLSLKIIDMPVHYGDRVYGATNISRWKHGWLLLKMTVFASRRMKFI